ncbi:MAG TPA: hypothetical protein VGH28_32400 [Polyangiaceae bacterium]|jgi:hypothetical protein
MKTFVVFAASFVVVACSSAPDSGLSSSSASSELKGCHGVASSSKPSSGDYYLTSFGFTADDDGIMSCGEYTKGGSWYYAASRQRFGCGSRIQIEANGKCVVAETDDYGPDECVESAAGEPIIDASPLVSEALFGVKSAGWSDRYAIHVTEVDASTPLGPCGASASAVTCHSATLGDDEPEGTCVQSKSDGVWYQCTDAGWESGVSGDAGPIGACTSEHPL